MAAKREKEFNFTKQHFNTLRKMAYDYSGIHTTDDKYEMYYARLAKRLRALKLTEFDKYIANIKQDKVEFIEFINAITTNVTSFEREPHHFAHLKEVLSTTQQRSIKIWSAGCSTGQEPYSILVNILPICRTRGISVSILATDLDTQVLMKAQNAVYPIDAISNYSDSVRKQFFLRGVGEQEGLVKVKPELTKCIEFKQLNLIHPWKIPTEFDFIFCRNVMIYFEADTKAGIIDRFYQNLKSEGNLFLGHSESIPRTNNNWTTIGKNIYKARAL